MNPMDPTPCDRDGMDKNCTFVLDKIVPDNHYRTFGRNDLSRGSETWIRGHVSFTPGRSKCFNGPKMSVPVPTMHKPITVRVNVVESSGESCKKNWIGFFIVIDDICTLIQRESSAFFDITVRTGFNEKYAVNVEYSPTKNCWGWSKCFKVETMNACKGNPFLINIGLGHELLPSFERIPHTTTNILKDPPTNFYDLCENQDDTIGDAEEINVEADDRKSLREAKPKQRHMLLDQEVRRCNSNFNLSIDSATDRPRTTVTHLSEHRGSQRTRSNRRKIRSAY